jgi:hypothetical protein
MPLTRAQRAAAHAAPRRQLRALFLSAATALLLAALPRAAHAARGLNLGGLPDQRVHELPGWRGEQARRRATAAAPTAAQGGGTSEHEQLLAAQAALAADAAAPVVTYLSWAPRIILVQRFLTPSEAAHVIELARCVRGAHFPRRLREPRCSAARARGRTAHARARTHATHATHTRTHAQCVPPPVCLRTHATPHVDRSRPDPPPAPRPPGAPQRANDAQHGG